MSARLTKEPNIKIEGTCLKGFEPVRKQFYENFLNGKEQNAQLCIYLGDRCVVDLWGSASTDETYGPDSFHVRIKLMS